MYILVAHLKIVRLHYHARVLWPIVADAKTNVMMMLIVMMIYVVSIVEAVQLEVLGSQTVV